jgi:hypothetical protein
VTSLRPQKLAPTLPTISGRSVGIARSQTKAMELLLLNTHNKNKWKAAKIFACLFKKEYENC